MQSVSSYYTNTEPRYEDLYECSETKNSVLLEFIFLIMVHCSSK